MLMAGVEMSFELPSNPNHATILWFYGSRAGTCVGSPQLPVWHNPQATWREHISKILNLV